MKTNPGLVGGIPNVRGVSLTPDGRIVKQGGGGSGGTPESQLVLSLKTEPMSVDFSQINIVQTTGGNNHYYVVFNKDITQKAIVGGTNPDLEKQVEANTQNIALNKQAIDNIKGLDNLVAGDNVVIQDQGTNER